MAICSAGQPKRRIARGAHPSGWPIWKIQDVGFARRQCQHAPAGRPDHDRRSRSLDGLRHALQTFELVVASVEVHLAALEQQLDDLNGFLQLSHARSRCFEGQPGLCVVGRFQPAPMPSSSRPPVSTSTVAASLAGPPDAESRCRGRTCPASGDWWRRPPRRAPAVARAGGRSDRRPAASSSRGPRPCAPGRATRQPFRRGWRGRQIESYASINAPRRGGEFGPPLRGRVPPVHVARQEHAAGALAVQLGVVHARRDVALLLERARRVDHAPSRADDQRVGRAEVLAARGRRSAPCVSVTAMSCWRMPGMPV